MDVQPDPEYPFCAPAWPVAAVHGPPAPPGLFSARGVLASGTSVYVFMVPSI
jgi:hypothetical protein